MKKDAFNRLKKLCEIPGVPGHEFHIRKHIIEEITPYVDSIEIDAMGNIIALKKGKESKKVMISAHMDEIGFIASHIDKEGFVRFQPLGGFDTKTLCSQRVVLYDEKRSLHGVIGCKPIHVMKADERKTLPEIDTLYIDTGLPADQVTKSVEVGMPIARRGECEMMGECVVSKSLDNRVCVHLLIETLRRLKNPAFDTYAIFSVQEEVGIRGAIAATGKVKPDIGIALDTTLANDIPGVPDQEQCTRFGGGAAIKVLDATAIANRELRLFLHKLAKRKKIKAQLELMQAGGTDTCALQYRSGHGAIAGCISVPTRYIHSTTECAKSSDIEASIELLKATLEELSSLKVTHLP